MNTPSIDRQIVSVNLGVNILTDRFSTAKWILKFWKSTLLKNLGADRGCLEYVLLSSVCIKTQVVVVKSVLKIGSVTTVCQWIFFICASLITSWKYNVTKLCVLGARSHVGCAQRYQWKAKQQTPHTRVPLLYFTQIMLSLKCLLHVKKIFRGLKLGRLWQRDLSYVILVKTLKYSTVFYTTKINDAFCVCVQQVCIIQSWSITWLIK